MTPGSEQGFWIRERTCGFVGRLRFRSGLEGRYRGQSSPVAALRSSAPLPDRLTARRRSADPIFSSVSNTQIAEMVRSRRRPEPGPRTRFDGQQLMEFLERTFQSDALLSVTPSRNCKLATRKRRPASATKIQEFLTLLRS